MSAITDAEELALSLSDTERARLAEKLIASLPGPYIQDDGDGLDEAVRRSREMKENPSMGISIEELDEMVRKRFPQCVSE
jgi:putative addiction module component (TIGR02574 family)